MELRVCLIGLLSHKKWLFIYLNFSFGGVCGQCSFFAFVEIDFFMDWGRVDFIFYENEKNPPLPISS